MKNIKILSMITLGCLALLLTGCGENSTHTLTCEKYWDDERTIINFKFNDDETKIENVDVTINWEFSEETSDEIVERGKNFYESTYCDGEGYKCSVEIKDDKIVVNMSGPADKLDSFGIDDFVGKSLEESKKLAEDGGLTCKR